MWARPNEASSTLFQVLGHKGFFIMSEQWILVDGYSVLHAWPRFATRKARQLPLQQRREMLVGVLRQYADHSRRRVTVVFDAYAAKHKAEGKEPTQGVEVIFSERGKTAATNLKLS